MSEEQHSLKVSVENDFIITKFTCAAPIGALCRLSCPDGCDEVPCSHEMVDSGKCHAKEWFGAVDWLECHEAYAHESVLYEGPVNAFWDGDEFQWQIDKSEPSDKDATIAHLSAVIEEATEHVEDAIWGYLMPPGFEDEAHEWERLRAILDKAKNT